MYHGKPASCGGGGLQADAAARVGLADDPLPVQSHAWGSRVDLGLLPSWHGSFVEDQRRIRRAVGRLGSPFHSEDVDADRVVRTVQADLRKRISPILDDDGPRCSIED